MLVSAFESKDVATESELNEVFGDVQAVESLVNDEDIEGMFSKDLDELIGCFIKS